MAAGMKTILFLSFLLASGIICVILSCALFGNWLPLLVVLTYLVAPLPNAITKRLARGSSLYGDENEYALFKYCQSPS